MNPCGQRPPTPAPGASPRPSARWWQSPWAARALVAVSAVLVYGPSVTFGFIGLDDRDFVVDDREFLARPVNLLRIFTRAYMHVVDGQHAYYRPLVTASYILDAQWSGVRPVGYHVTNVILHALASVLFLTLLHRFALGRAAILGALAFAVHPALAPDVAWIPGRNDSLLAVGVLSAWLLLPTDAPRRPWGRAALHAAFFALSLLTKETALVAPLIWALHMALFEPDSHRRGQRGRRLLVLLLGWGIAVAARLALSPLGIGDMSLVRLWSVIANSPLVVTSLGALVFPVNPSLLAVSEDLSLAPGLVAFGLLAVLTRLVPGVRMRVVALGAATLVVFLAPALAAGTTLVLNSRLYVPACGLIVWLSEIVRALFLIFDRRLIGSFAVTTLVALAFMTVSYESTFRDRRTFARAEVEAAPHSAMAHFCRGQTFQIDGESDRALGEYRLALSLGASEVVHNNIAVIAMARGDWADAERELRNELAANPHYARAYRNLAIVLRKQHRPEEARAADERADALESDKDIR